MFKILPAQRCACNAGYTDDGRIWETRLNRFDCLSGLPLQNEMHRQRVLA